MVIPNYNGRRFLKACLDSLRTQDYPRMEIMVVDDASSDESPEWVRQHYPKFNLIALKQNLGFCGACNTGVEAARGDLIALVNNDTILPKNFVSGLVACLARHPRAWVVGARMHNLNLDMRLHPHAPTLSVTGVIINNVFKNPGQVFGVPGAGLMFRREVGLPFDADYRFFHDDVYLSWRAWLAGHEVVEAPEIVVKHLGSASVSDQPARNRFLMERNRLLNFFTFWSSGTLLRLLPLLKLALILENLQDIFRGRGIGPRWRAYGWLLANRGAVAAKRRNLQAQRRCPDAVVLARMSRKLTNGQDVLAGMLNGVSAIWCRVMGIKTAEMS